MGFSSLEIGSREWFMRFVDCSVLGRWGRRSVAVRILVVAERRFGDGLVTSMVVSITVIST